jgi:hypothetical protein
MPALLGRGDLARHAGHRRRDRCRTGSGPSTPSPTASAGCGGSAVGHMARVLRLARQRRADALLRRTRPSANRN